MPCSNVKLVTALQGSNALQVMLLLILCKGHGPSCAIHATTGTLCLARFACSDMLCMLCSALRRCAHAQLTLCGQTPETALTAALASVNFYCGQQELSAQLRQSQLQRKIEKVQEACKKKLQEVHNGYTQASAALLQCWQVKAFWANIVKAWHARPDQERCAASNACGMVGACTSCA